MVTELLIWPPDLHVTCDSWLRLAWNDCLYLFVAQCRSLSQSWVFWYERVTTPVCSISSMFILWCAHAFCCHSFIHSFFLSFFLSFIRSFIHSFTYSLIHSFMHLFIHSFTCSFIHSLVHSFIHSFIHSLIHSFTCSFIHSLIHSSVSYTHLTLPTIYSV